MANSMMSMMAIWYHWYGMSMYKWGKREKSQFNDMITLNRDEDEDNSFEHFDPFMMLVLVTWGKRKIEIS